MTIRLFVVVLTTLVLPSLPAFATSLTITTSALPSMTFAPSGDTFSLTADNVSTSGPGTIAIETGSFVRGITTTSSQTIPFSFSETMTLNGVAKTFNIFGQDTVTSTSDTLTILAGSPINFGAYTFTLSSSTFAATSSGQVLPVTLSGVVATSPVPEPAGFALLGTGLLGAFVARPNSILRLRHQVSLKKSS